uniref:Uncharacterized protein n=1 Tax=Ananas comosus var. bracteatus TaxID=296719 RepID=A0A6V7NVX5_ANACO|nr:unnamed protein product [Ananas comosus var. bracteatus]
MRLLCIPRNVRFIVLLAIYELAIFGASLRLLRIPRAMASSLGAPPLSLFLAIATVQRTLPLCRPQIPELPLTVCGHALHHNLTSTIYTISEPASVEVWVR